MLITTAAADPGVPATNILRYQNEAGTSTYVDDAEKVPEKYRSLVETAALPEIVRSDDAFLDLEPREDDPRGTYRKLLLAIAAILFLLASFERAGFYPHRSSAFRSSRSFRATRQIHDSSAVDDVLQDAFLVYLFGMLGKLACIDGTVTDDEDDAIERFIRNRLGLDSGARVHAIEVYRSVRHSVTSFEEYLQQFVRKFGDNGPLCEIAFEALAELVWSDGIAAAAEIECLEKAAAALRIPEATRNTTLRRFQGSALSPYEVLGCEPGATLDEVKRCYRALAKEFHPDKLRHQGLPEELLKRSEQKFLEIQRAYELLQERLGETRRGN